MYKNLPGKQNFFRSGLCRVAWIVVSLFLCCPLCYAQTANDKLLNTLVEKNILTRDEAGRIAAVDSTKQTNVIEKSQNLIRKGLNNSPYLNIGGYGKLLYQYGSQVDIKHELRPRVVFLWADGKINDQLKYFVMYDFVSATLFEYYAEWMPSTAFKLRGGQFKVPFTLENPISLASLESVQNTRSVAALAGMAGDVGVNNGGGRDIGIQASGSFLKVNNRNLIHYAAGVFQGVGINRRENNQTKDFAGTVCFEPVKDWKWAAGLYAGQASYQKVGELAAESHVRNRWAVSSEYSSDRWHMRAEWINGNDGGIQREGLYAMAGYYFVPGKLNGFARFDHFVENKSLDRKVNDCLVGLNYYIAPMCRFMVNYQYSNFSENWAGMNDSHAVFGELQLFF